MITTHLPDGTPVVFEDGAWGAIGELLGRTAAEEDRLAHWRAEEERAANIRQLHEASAPDSHCPRRHVA